MRIRERRTRYEKFKKSIINGISNRTDELDDTIYDAEMTVNIILPQGYTNATVTQSGNTIQSIIADGMASINVKPDGGNITVAFS